MHRSSVRWWAARRVSLAPDRSAREDRRRGVWIVDGWATPNRLTGGRREDRSIQMAAAEAPKHGGGGCRGALDEGRGQLGKALADGVLDGVQVLKDCGLTAEGKSWLADTMALEEFEPMVRDLFSRDSRFPLPQTTLA